MICEVTLKRLMNLKIENLMESGLLENIKLWKKGTSNGEQWAIMCELWIIISYSYFWVISSWDDVGKVGKDLLVGLQKSFLFDFIFIYKELVCIKINKNKFKMRTRKKCTLHKNLCGLKTQFPLHDLWSIRWSPLSFFFLDTFYRRRNLL